MLNIITSIKEWKQYNENILIPRNLEVRKEKLRQHNIKLFSHEIIEGSLIIDETFDNIPKELVKIKEIKGNVFLTINKGYIPSWLKDVKIEGFFDCSNINLISLDNCPQYIRETLYCDHNKLKSLEGCAKYIGGNLFCKYNEIIELQLPKDVELKGNLYN